MSNAWVCMAWMKVNLAKIYGRWSLGSKPAKASLISSATSAALRVLYLLDQPFEGFLLIHEHFQVIKFLNKNAGACIGKISRSFASL